MGGLLTRLPAAPVSEISTLTLEMILAKRVAGGKVFANSIARLASNKQTFEKKKRSVAMYTSSSFEVLFEA
jgi:hypothetical protein